MAEEINYSRRRFLGIAAMTVAAAELGIVGFSERTIEDKTATCPN